MKRSHSRNSDAHIALQPICDTEFRHRADAVLYRRSGDAKDAAVSNPSQASASSVVLAIYEIGVDRLVGKRDLFVKIPSIWLTDDTALPSPDSQVIFDIEVSGDLSLARLKGLVEAGYRLCLSYSGQWPRQIEFAQAEYIKLDAQQAPEDREALRHLKQQQPTTKWIANRVSDSELFDRTAAMPFDYFQGFFYAEPMTLTSDSSALNTNEHVLISVLEKLHCAEPDFNQLTALLTQAPKATLLLLRRVNSSDRVKVRKIENVSEAMARLGLNELKSLVAMLLLMSRRDSDALLLPDILTVAAFCRLLAQKQTVLEPEVAFSVGLLSQLPAVLSLTLDDLLVQLSVSKDIEAALRTRDGEYGKILRLVEAHANNELAPQNRQLITRLNHEYLNARAWTQSMLGAL